MSLSISGWSIVTFIISVGGMAIMIFTAISDRDEARSLNILQLSPDGPADIRPDDPEVIFRLRKRREWVPFWCVFNMLLALAMTAFGANRLILAIGLIVSVMVTIGFVTKKVGYTDASGGDKFGLVVALCFGFVTGYLTAFVVMKSVTIPFMSSAVALAVLAFAFLWHRFPPSKDSGY